MMRAIVSELLPAVNGTISRSGRSGQPAACAGAGRPRSRRQGSNWQAGTKHISSPRLMPFVLQRYRTNRCGFRIAPAQRRSERMVGGEVQDDARAHQDRPVAGAGGLPRGGRQRQHDHRRAHLKVTQSAISQQLKLLEAEMGVTLMDREHPSAAPHAGRSERCGHTPPSMFSSTPTRRAPRCGRSPSRPLPHLRIAMFGTLATTLAPALVKAIVQRKLPITHGFDPARHGGAARPRPVRGAKSTSSSRRTR